LFVSALFSAAETALLSLGKIRIRHMVEEEVKNSELVSKIVENKNKLLGTILIGNNASNIAGSAIATSLAIHIQDRNAVLIGTIVMTIAVLIFAEIIPKSIAAQNPEKVSLTLARLISIMIAILNPVVVVLTHITNFIIKLFGGRILIQQPFITEEELKTIVNVSREEGVLEIEETEMINNVFEFGDLITKDVMIQRMDIVALDIEATYDEIIEIFKEERFSRMPVYSETMDDIVGILYVKDLILYDGTKEQFNIDNFIRDPHYTYEFKKIAELLREMKKIRTHMSIVLDEYGGVAGMVTIEDLIEEIVGEIEDEYDEEVAEIEFIKEGEYVAEGSARIEIVNEIIGTSIESEEFDSIGGFLIGELGRFPETDELIKYNDMEFIVEEIDKNRIKKIRIFLKS
jgi:putative hemolysin